MQDTKQITAYGLYEFLLEIQQAVKEGYSFSDKNEYFPNQIGIGCYTCTMVKAVENSPKDNLISYNKPDEAKQAVRKVGRSKTISKETE